MPIRFTAAEKVTIQEAKVGQSYCAFVSNVEEGAEVLVGRE